MNTSEVKASIELIQNNIYSENACFLCNRQFNNIDILKTEEHVFPKWLQEEFNLWNRNMKLPNQTRIKYKDIRIPCCVACNGILLSGLEISMKQAFSKGYKYVRQMNKIDLYRWMSKIFIGKLYKDTILSLEQYDPQLGPLMESRILKDFQILQIWILLLNNGLENPEKLDSMIILKSQTPKNKAQRFHYIMEYIYGVLCIRINDCLLLVNFKDNGLLLDNFKDYYDKISIISLHPFQCLEVIATFIFHAKITSVNINVSFSEVDEKIKPLVTIDDIDRVKLSIKNSDLSTLAIILSEYTNIPFDALYLSDYEVKSFLFDKNKNLIRWTVDKDFPIYNERKLLTNKQTERILDIEKYSRKDTERNAQSLKIDELINAVSESIDMAKRYTSMASKDPNQRYSYYKIAADHYLEAVMNTKKLSSVMGKNNNNMRMPNMIMVEVYNYEHKKMYMNMELTTNAVEACKFAEEAYKHIDKANNLLERNIGSFDSSTRISFHEKKSYYMYEKFKCKTWICDIKTGIAASLNDYKSASEHSDTLVKIQGDILSYLSKYNKLDIDQATEQQLYDIYKCINYYCNIVNLCMMNPSEQGEKEIADKLNESFKLLRKVEKNKPKNLSINIEAYENARDNLIIINYHIITYGLSTSIIKIYNKVLSRNNKWIVDSLEFNPFQWLRSKLNDLMHKIFN